MSKHGSLSYQYDEFMKYKIVNNILPQNLVPYCTQDYGKDVYPDISVFADQLNNIISSITKGGDPNDVILRNYIKFYVNMIHQGNYEEYLDKLKNLQYTSQDIMHCLLTELISCASRCQVSINGFNFKDDNKHRGIPEVCADVAKQFTNIAANCEDKSISFHEELFKICQQFFEDFVDLNKSLDENNEHMSDNYKGFMTFMGLLYTRGIITNKIAIDCMETIKRSIFCSSDLPKQMKCHNCEINASQIMGYKKTESKLAKCICFYDCELTNLSADNPIQTHRKNIECANLYKGYEHLLSHVINTLNKTSDLVETFKILQTKLSNANKSDPNYLQLENQWKSSKVAIDKIGDFVNTLIKNHQEMIGLNKKYRSLNKTQLIPPFKTPILLTHNGMGNNLNKIRDLVKNYCTHDIAIYENVAFIKSKN